MVKRQDRPKESQRTQVVGVRVTVAQRKVLQRAADAHGLDLGSFVRMAALKLAGYEPTD